MCTNSSILLVRLLVLARIGLHLRHLRLHHLHVLLRLELRVNQGLVQAGVHASALADLHPAEVAT